MGDGGSKEESKAIVTASCEGKEVIGDQCYDRCGGGLEEIGTSCKSRCADKGLPSGSSNAVCGKSTFSRKATSPYGQCASGEEYRSGACWYACPPGSTRIGNSTICGFQPLDSHDTLFVDNWDDYDEGEEIEGYPGYRKTAVKPMIRNGGLFDFRGRAGPSGGVPSSRCDDGFEKGTDGWCYEKRKDGVPCKNETCWSPCPSQWDETAGGECKRPGFDRKGTDPMCPAGYALTKDKKMCASTDESKGGGGGANINWTWIAIAGVAAVGIGGFFIVRAVKPAGASEASASGPSSKSGQEVKLVLAKEEKEKKAEQKEEKKAE